ncbi:MAG: hypothetical protein LC646_11240 [Xanthomonadaceae bacterium]|nr:hypothetical protein [Xanthomonadaceae bacterium]
MSLDYTLTRLSEILETHEGDHAAWLRDLASRRKDETIFYASLNSQRMWGGAGSIANEALADNPGIDPARWELEIREFRGLMIDLAEHLRARDRHYPDIDFWLSAFSSWQQAGI